MIVLSSRSIAHYVGENGKLLCGAKLRVRFGGQALGTCGRCYRAMEKKKTHGREAPKPPA